MEIKQHKLEYVEYDEERYSEFIQEQTRQLVRMGFDREDAEKEAHEIAAMYRHHFRTWTRSAIFTSRQAQPCAKHDTAKRR